MSNSLDGIISCKGFAYNNGNINTDVNNRFIRLGIIHGVTGSHIKIECILGYSNTQGQISSTDTLPSPTTSINAPILLTIYGSFHDNTNDSYCNFEGFYTVMGNDMGIDGVYIESGINNYEYTVYISLLNNSVNNNLNYFVYLPKGCNWVHSGTATGFLFEDNPNSWFKYPKL
jgi:hypothetical protein